jgi:hypothetical protein
VTARDDLAALIHGCNAHHDNVGEDDWTYTADAILAAGWRSPNPDYSIAWITFRKPDGSMRYTTIAAGRDDEWVANGEELTGYASVDVIL